MKKLLTIGALALVSSFAVANKPLVLQPGEPLPMGAKIDNPQQNQLQSHKQYKTKENLNLIGASVFAGYTILVVKRGFLLALK